MALLAAVRDLGVDEPGHFVGRVLAQDLLEHGARLGQLTGFGGVHGFLEFGR